jgi:hypothetical protein
MSDSSLSIEGLEQKYNQISAGIITFLHGEAPTTKTESLVFISLCTKNETNITTLQSSIGLTAAEIQRDFNTQLWEIHQENKPSGKRITKHEVDILKLEPVLVDLQYRLDCLKVYSESLESYKWLLKFRREQAIAHLQHLKGMDF